MNIVLTRVLEESRVDLLASIPRELLTTQELEIIEWATSYVREFSVTPTLKTAMDAFEVFVPMLSSSSRWEDRPPTSQEAIDRLVKERILKTTRSLLQKVINGIDETKTVDAAPLDAARELLTLNRGLSRYTLFDRDSYLRSMSIPLPFRILNTHIGGLDKGDYLTILGKLGTGKSTIAQWIAKTLWEMGLKVFLVSTEMDAKSVFQRIDGMVGGFNPLVFRREERDEEMDSAIFLIKESLAGRKSSKGEIFVPTVDKSNPSQIFTQAQQLNCDIIIVDGVYLLSPSDYKGGAAPAWEKMLKVSNEIKALSNSSGIPVIATSQLKRGTSGSVDTDDTGKSIAISEDSDFVLAIKPTLEENTFDMELIKNRYGPRCGFRISIDYETMTLTEEGITAVKEITKEEWTAL